DPTSFYVIGSNNVPTPGNSVNGTTNNSVTIHFAVAGAVTNAVGAGAINITAPGTASGNPLMDETTAASSIGTLSALKVGVVNTDVVAPLHGNPGQTVALP